MKITLDIQTTNVLDCLRSPHIKYWASGFRSVGVVGAESYSVTETDEGDDGTEGLSPVTHVFGLPEIAKALGLMALRAPTRFGSIILGHGDGVDADLLIQYAVFGEEKYP